MRRRTFIAALAAAAWPLAARAGQRMPRIGYLAPPSAEADRKGLEAFMAGLAELGYVPGKTVVLEARFADGDEARLAAAARELVEIDVDVIVTGGQGVLAAYTATKTIPIVSAVTLDLVAQGIAASLGHPGGNVTGETFFAPELSVKQVELLKQVKPVITRVGLLVPEHNPFDAFTAAAVARVKTLGVALEPIELGDPRDCDRALSAAPGASIDGLVVVDSPQFVVGDGPALIAAAAMRRRLPAVGGPTLAASGGLLGYGVDFAPMFRRAAAFVDKILKGTKPGDIPIEQATTFVTIVNMKTARTLGLDFPPAVLAAADAVIE
ncbi:putative ABC transport system substrate-binding protein [Roseiarcus fermentans]|uniref:Putative ABC transport system substrate-binding protein n=1 Tax=Roseiarcus fermentans TaxID=1473586 RepID=A0A366FHH9_9HYPH|nr:ABC transporter substrate-binding protein [Roseiarcus fermentans]RBP14133.1 putative ABC transport system substrate-binding protein [Roseiarcus fermentans]